MIIWIDGTYGSGKTKISSMINGAIKDSVLYSADYFDRAACLNEMGEAWAMKQKWTGILLSGFDFKNICGCIDPMQVSIKLDDEDIQELKGDEFETRIFIN